MKVKNIVRNCAVLLDDDSLLADIDSTTSISTQNQSIINKLVECVNLVNKKIATNYCVLKDKVVLKSNNNKISLSTISTKEIIEIIQVLINNVKSGFSVDGGYLFTNDTGIMTITYTYMPNSVVYTDNIDYYYNKVNESIFAYGVVSEYLYIMCNVVDAKMWEDKFNSALSQSTKCRRDIIMPRRRWY